MKFRMDKTLRFWVGVAYDAIKSDHDNVTKQQLLSQVLRQYEKRGDAQAILPLLSRHASLIARV
jgi:hypothetical protein